MKILRIIYDWPKPWSGLAPHPYEITVAQSKLGHEIDVFGAKWPKSGPEEIKGVKLHTFMREPFQATLFFTTAVSMFFYYKRWRAKNTPDIIHSHGHFAIWLYLYRAILKKHFPWSDELKVPLVVHFHKTAMGRWKKLEEDKIEISPLSKYIQWPLEVKAEKWSIDAGAAFVFVSEEVKKEAIEYYGADPKKCFVLESGVNTDIFGSIGQEERDKSRNELGVDIYDKVILNHGMMVERKNIHLLVESLKYLPINYKLLLVGPGDASYIEKLTMAAKKDNVEDRVIMVGYTPYPEVPIAYQVSDLFVLPSSWEGSPKVVTQGLACGIPCLVSGFKLGENIDGLFYLENLEPKYIAEISQQLIEAKPPVDTHKVKLIYSWDQRVRLLEEVYEFAKENYL